MLTSSFEIITLQKKADYSIVISSTLRTIENYICLIWTGSLNIFLKELAMVTMASSETLVAAENTLEPY